MFLNKKTEKLLMTITEAIENLSLTSKETQMIKSGKEIRFLIKLNKNQYDSLNEYMKDAGKKDWYFNTYRIRYINGWKDKGWFKISSSSNGQIKKVKEKLDKAPDPKELDKHAIIRIDEEFKIVGDDKDSFVSKVTAYKQGKKIVTLITSECESINDYNKNIVALAKQFNLSKSDIKSFPLGIKDIIIQKKYKGFERNF